MIADVDWSRVNVAAHALGHFLGVAAWMLTANQSAPDLIKSNDRHLVSPDHGGDYQGTSTDAPPMVSALFDDPDHDRAGRRGPDRMVET